MTGLTFDEATHSYFFDGNPVPGVTSILKPITDYSAVPPHVLQAAANFGKAVHLACELDDLGELDESQLDPALMPYLEGWRNFSREHGVQWFAIEQPVYNKALRYAGTPDRYGIVDGLNAVVDIKSTAQLYASVGPQLAAYANALTPSPSMKRYAVQLKADGTYTLKPYNDPTDWPLFASLLTVRNWCSRYQTLATI